MDDFPRKVILTFIVVFLFFSLVFPIFLIYESDLISITSRAGSGGSVSVTVSATCGDGVCEGSETCSTCSSDCGACATTPTVSAAAGGGGGGGGGRTTPSPVTYMIDFREKESYLLGLFSFDRVICVFDSGNQYSFNVDRSAPGTVLVLNYSGMIYNIGWDEIAFFDLDADGKDDLEITFIGNDVRWTYVGIELAPEKVIPLMKKEKLVKSTNYFEKIDLDLIIIILVVILVIVAASFVYHHLKLRHIEKGQARKIRGLYSKYKSKRKTKKDKIEIRKKLVKQRELLMKARKSGYVSKESYSKGAERINNLLRKVKG